MRKARLSLLLFILFVSFSDRNAFAFWRYIWELSGPGGFWALDAVIPWSFASPRLTRDINNRNLKALRSIGLNTQKLSPAFSEFAQNAGEILLFEKHLEKQMPAAASVRDIESFARAFLKAAGDKDSDIFQLWGVALMSRAEEVFQSMQEEVLASMTEELRRKVRHFSASPIGIFGSKAAIPRIEGEDSKTQNLFFNLSLGFAWSLNNDLDYGPAIEGEPRVYWLSVYTPIEYRFGQSEDLSRNFFVNAGPALNYFIGNTFDDFPHLSLKLQGGYRIEIPHFVPIHFGAEVEFFGSPLTPDLFGALPDGFDRDRIGYGVFVEMELYSPLKK